tara:strand:+ start:233 stop:541 length:309 start_codon:yes stop_codon:yes gene_type:complete
MTDILKKAEEAVRDRGASYAPPSENFARIAAYWQDHFAATGRPIKITAADVAPMMILLKLARMNGAHSSPGSIDNLVDICGYALCHADVWEADDGSAVREMD